MSGTPETLHNLPLERTLLGALLRNAAILGTVTVDRGVFWRDQHRNLFELIEGRFARGEPVDPEILVSWVVEHGIESEIGAAAEIFALVEQAGRSDPAAVVAQLQRLARKRDALRSMRAAADSLKDPTLDYEAALSGLLATLTRQVSTAGHVASIEKLAIEVFDTERRRVDAKTSRRMKTGMREFDRVFSGLSRRGASLFIAASGMGKTTLANTFAISLASQGERVVVHGTETTTRERAEDLLFAIARVDPDEWDALVQSPQTDLFSQQRFDQLWSRLTSAGDHLSRLPIVISSKVGGTVEALAARTRALKMAGLCTVVIADYIQDFQWTAEIAKGEIVKQVGHVTTCLKDLSADLEVPIIEFAQRSDEKRGVTEATARPQMWECQHSSRAHQDAEEVFALYRNEYYVEQLKDWKRTLGNEGIIEIIRRKVRRGRRGTAELGWDGPSKWIGDPLRGFSPMTAART